MKRLLIASLIILIFAGVGYCDDLRIVDISLTINGFTFPIEFEQKNESGILKAKSGDFEITAWSSTPKPEPKTCWEYKEASNGVPYYPEPGVKMFSVVALDEYGKEGWELVDTQRGNFPGDPIVFYFKRPKPCKGD